MRTPHFWCVGCEQGSRSRAVKQENAFAFAMVRKPATGKYFEPSWRLSETIGPRCMSAFRVAVLRAGVTKSCPARDRSGGSCVRGALGSGPLPERTDALAHGPHRGADLRTCSHCEGTGRAPASVQGDGSYARVAGSRAGTVHMLPHCQAMPGALQAIGGIGSKVARAGSSPPKPTKAGL